MIGAAANDPTGFLKAPPAHLKVVADVARTSGRASFYQGNGLQAGKVFSDALNAMGAGMRQMNQLANAQVQLANGKPFLPHG